MSVYSLLLKTLGVSPQTSIVFEEMENHYCIVTNKLTSVLVQMCPAHLRVWLKQTKQENGTSDCDNDRRKSHPGSSCSCTLAL